MPSQEISALKKKKPIYTDTLFGCPQATPSFSMLHTACNIEKWVWPGDEATLWELSKNILEYVCPLVCVESLPF